MNVITRQEAIAQGLKYYFTGLACKYGHVDKRRLDNGECMECARGRAAQNYARKKPHVVRNSGKNKAAREAAAAAGLLTYLPVEPCKRGHSSARYVKRYSCVACERELEVEYRKNNAKKIAKYKREYYTNNDGKRKYYIANKKRIRSYEKEWRKRNRGRVNASKARYKARKRNQTPTLTTSEKLYIIHLYEDAALIGYHVDHIVPLSKGGLHHPDNLQIVSADYNLRKNAKEWGETQCK